MLFADWILSEEDQQVLAVELGKGIAMAGLPEYAVGPEFGNQLKRYMTELQKILGDGKSQ